MPQAAVSVVVVSYNTRDLLRRCLGSVVGGAVEVIVVDNDSGDGSAEMAEAEFPSVRLIRAGRNLGFASATNLGLRQAICNFLLLLNPDTEIIGDALLRMASFLDGNPTVGAVGPSLFYPDGRPQDSAFSFPTLPMAFLDFFPLNHRLIKSRLNGRYSAPPDDSPFRIGHPLGAAMMVRREALEKVGMLDETFFMYCEEVDWCIRAARCGWSTYCVPSARVVHHSGQSTSQFKEKMFLELHRSRQKLYEKHYSLAFIVVNRMIVRAGVAREIVRARLRAARGQMRRDELDRRLAAYRSVWDL